MLMLDESRTDDLRVADDSREPVSQGSKMLIPVVEGQPLRSGVKTVTGSIPAGTLKERFQIPYRDSLRKTGYQRKPQESRINRLMNQIRRNRVDVPTSVLFNVRGNKARDLIIKDEQGHLWLQLDENSVGDVIFYVVDGQHRVLAVVRLVGEDLDKWKNYKLQFVLMLGASESEEVNQFYVVNSTAKSVRTDLALDLLKQRADADGRVMEDAIETGQRWKIDGQTIVEKLYADSPVWRGKIRLANAEKGDSILPAASFVASLRPLLVSPYFAALSTQQQVKVLDAYWQGIRETCREPFDNEADNYALQKGIGVTAMHELLVTVIEHVRSKGESAFDANAYRIVMESVLANLDGDNRDGENVSGSDFWLTAPLGGAAGSYSSSAGKRVLIAKLRQLLPRMEAE
jgi:DGQHR domain-containing protein